MHSLVLQKKQREHYIEKGFIYLTDRLYLRSYVEEIYLVD